MSISATLANAFSGLTAASRAAQIISSNVSNVMTDGYARRELSLSPRHVGGDGAGVQVDGVLRLVDENLLRERRLAAASVGSADVPAGFFQDVLDLLGMPGEESSLSARLAGFETALLDAASRPESEARLTAVLTAAQSLAGKLNQVSDGVQGLREDADQRIGNEVSRLNLALAEIAELNGQILRAKGLHHDYPSLLDHRQRLIDEIGELVPIRQLPRDNGAVALYSLGGALLVDIEPGEFAFESRAPIVPDMTLASGALSGLTLNGEPLPTAGAHSPIAGGLLAGLFGLRDELAVDLQADLDAVARDLVSRFEDAAVDPTLALGDPGLFTDRGSAIDPLDIVGLAGRIEVNALADPSRGGEIRRIRDGLGATLPGPVGDASLLVAALDALNAPRAPVGGSFSVAARGASDLAASLISGVGQSLQGANIRLSYETARSAGLEEAFLADGVDTDQEMQRLLLIEQAYAANARVIRTADELIQQLIGL